MILARFTQQPNEFLPRLIDFKTEWGQSTGQVVSGFDVLSDAGLTVHSKSMSDGVVRFVCGGGEDGQNYKVTVRVTTNEPGIVKEADIIIRVRES